MKTNYFLNGIAKNAFEQQTIAHFSNFPSPFFPFIPFFCSCANATTKLKNIEIELILLFGNFFKEKKT